MEREEKKLVCEIGCLDMSHIMPKTIRPIQSQKARSILEVEGYHYLYSGNKGCAVTVRSAPLFSHRQLIRFSHDLAHSFSKK